MREASTNQYPAEDRFDHHSAIVLESHFRQFESSSSVESISYLPVQTFIGNAARSDGVATGTVHRALHALLASTRILQDLFKRFPGHPLQLDLADIDNVLLLQLLFQLNAAFADFENLLFKAVDGAGPGACVAMGIIFLVTLILRKIAQQFGLPVLIESGVENTLQALFGLLSVTYRNTGVFNVLQEYSGRELSPCKFQTSEIAWRNNELTVVYRFGRAVT